MTSRLTQLQQRWMQWQPTKTQAFWTCAIAVVATLIGGFGVAGWVSAGTARQMVSDAADNARRELAVAVCVEEFMQSAGALERLAKLKKTHFYERSEIVATAGFATMPDQKEPDGYVAARCAAALDELPAKGPKT